jgi:hypothetical protein
MTISLRTSLLEASVGALFLLAPSLVGDGGTLAQAPPPAVDLGIADPAAPLELTPAERTAILNAVREDKLKPNAGALPDGPVAVGVQLPPSMALKILPEAALAQAPAAKTVQYTMIDNKVVLVDPTNMRVVDIISR